MRPFFPPRDRFDIFHHLVEALSFRLDIAAQALPHIFPDTREDGTQENDRPGNEEGVDHEDDAGNTGISACGILTLAGDLDTGIEFQQL